MSRFRALWQASLNATKRAFTWNLEDLIPSSERYIFNFNSKEELKKWHLYSDSKYGGVCPQRLWRSDMLEMNKEGGFCGNSKVRTPWGINYSGQVAMNQRMGWALGSEMFDGFIDLDAYDTIAVKVKGDGRCYISTIYTKNWIPLARYLPTWRGNIIDVDLEMNPSRIVGMSLSVNAEGGVPGARSGPGDFQMEIDCIKALRTTQ
ncbi:unnamed protein product [Camellia sinensis]